MNSIIFEILFEICTTSNFFEFEAIIVVVMEVEEVATAVVDTNLVLYSLCSITQVNVTAAYRWSEVMYPTSTILFIFYHY